MPRDSLFLVLCLFLLYNERQWRKRQDMTLCLALLAQMHWIICASKLHFLALQVSHCTGKTVKKSKNKCSHTAALPKQVRKRKKDTKLDGCCGSQVLATSHSHHDIGCEGDLSWVQSHRQPKSLPRDLRQGLKLAAPNQLWAPYFPCSKSEISLLSFHSAKYSKCLVKAAIFSLFFFNWEKIRHSSW